MSPVARRCFGRPCSKLNYALHSLGDATLICCSRRRTVHMRSSERFNTSILHRPTIILLRAKLHYTHTAPATNTSYEHHQRTPPTDKNLPHPNILTCRDVMLGSGIAMWQICCRTVTVVSLSVGGVRSRCPCSGVWFLLDVSMSPALYRAMHCM